MTEIERGKLQYMVGGLLYCPAIKNGLAEKIEKGCFPYLTSMAFCLEDSIRDESLDEAEVELFKTLNEVYQCNISKDKLPLLFIRIRSPEHLKHVHKQLSPLSKVITGYILPKFDLSNCDQYKSIVLSINSDRLRPLYIMPVLESKMIADVENRTTTMHRIKDNLASIKDYVLNVRVGGNDLCNLYGLRRGMDQNIYQIGLIRDILVDILNVFADDYVVSGPVWEYFGTDVSSSWATGLRNELVLDRLNGFIGKTAIHPCQLPLIFESMKVRKTDYEDALSILGWNSAKFGVKKSSDGTRMNELKCHGKWASQIATLGDIYGVRDE